LAGQSYTTAQQCFDYYYGQTDKVLVNQDYPADYPYIVMDGLVFNLDAGITQSYPGSGTVWTDINGLGPKNNGTLINGPTFNSANGGSIVFDGVDDYIVIPTITNSVYSIDFWYKMNGNDGSYGYFASSGLNGFAISEGGTGEGLSFGKIYYWQGAANIIADIPSTTNWNHICVIINTSTNYLQLYGNSINLNNSTISSMSTSVSNIGRFIGGNSHFLKGNMGTYKIYNRALSATEVLQNFNAQKGRFGL